MQDYRRAELTVADRAMLDYAAKLTRTPSEMTADDIETLRGQGFDDDGINEIVHITALFNYYDRLADGLGIELEPEWADS